MARRNECNGVEIRSTTGDHALGIPPLSDFNPASIGTHEGRNKALIYLRIHGVGQEPALVSATLRHLADAVERHGEALLVPKEFGTILHDGSLLAFCDDIRRQAGPAGTDAG